MKDTAPDLIDSKLGQTPCLKSVQNLELVENVVEIEFKEVY